MSAPLDFLNLPETEQKVILDDASSQLNRSSVLLEKDVWVCWTLREVFTIPGLHLAFKGGTSLSKAYRVIERFSEDLDLTLHYGDIAHAEGLPNKAAKALTLELRQNVERTVRDTVKPALERAFQKEFGRLPTLIIEGEHHEQLRLFYRTPQAGQSAGYVKEAVLLEFGGRNSAEPSERIHITADIAALYPQLRFPEAQVETLSVLRTYWEKVTLIHAEASRNSTRGNYSRMTRHLYDLMRPHQQGYTARVLADPAILEDVVRYKSTFYGMGGVDYAACTQGKIRLTFAQEREVLLRQDHQQMKASNFFEEMAPHFDEVLHVLEALEGELNTALGPRNP